MRTKRSAPTSHTGERGEGSCFVSEHEQPELSPRVGLFDLRVCAPAWLETPPALALSVPESAAPPAPSPLSPESGGSSIEHLPSRQVPVEHAVPSAAELKGHIPVLGSHALTS
jgi:hypothetical protein